MPCLSAEIATVLAVLDLAGQDERASGSCTAFWIARFSGRAP